MSQLGSNCQEYLLAGSECACGAVFNYHGNLLQPGTTANWDACAHFPSMRRKANITLSLHGNAKGACNCPVQPAINPLIENVP